MTLFRLKAIVMLVVTGVWVVYVLDAVVRGNQVGLEWIGLPGGLFFALFGVVRRRNGNGDNGSAA
jgi:threonine/homoserine efflux transporter RhtA